MVIFQLSESPVLSGGADGFDWEREWLVLDIARWNRGSAMVTVGVRRMSLSLVDTILCQFLPRESKGLRNP